MKKILFVSYGGGHIQTLLPIINTLRNFSDVYIIGLGMGSKVLHENKIDHQKIIDYANTYELIEGLKLAEKFHESGQGISLADTAAYYGVGFTNLKQDYPHYYNQLFSHMGRRIFLPVGFFERIFTERKYDLVVTTNTSARYERAAIKAAINMGIDTLTVEDLLGTATSLSPDMELYFENETQLNYLRNIGFNSIYPVSNKIDHYYKTYVFDDIGTNGFWAYARLTFSPKYTFVNSEFTKNELLKKGSKSNIFVTGNPKYDNVVNKEYNIGNKEKIKVLYTTQPTPHRDKIIETIKNLSCVNKKIIFIIKPHPVDKIDYLSRYNINEGENIIILDRETDIFDEIQNVDIVFTEYSTTALDAFYSGVPVLTYSQNTEIVNYSKTRLAMNLNELNDLVKCVMEIVNNKNNILIDFKKSQESFVVKGSSIERIKNIIKEDILKI